jgi:hypothetical protein
MDTIEKLTMSVSALTHRIERLEQGQVKNGAQAVAQQLAREMGLSISWTSAGYHPGDPEHIKLALALRDKGWTFRKIAMVLGVTERTAKRWCKG